MKPIITVENLSKRYHLGQIGATTLRESAERFLNRVRLRKTIDHAGKTLDHRLQTSDQGGASAPSSSTSSLKSNVYGLKSSSDDTSELWALKDISFEVNQGEVLGIIGRNGAGKSTLLKILSRITEPTSGRAILRGRVASLLEVGTGFHPELTGRENIFLNGAILGMKKAEIARKFDEIVAFAEVERFIDTPVKRYSSGMYVRLAFAVAAHLEPEILIIDEVLAVGDAAFQRRCLGKMSEQAQSGKTVLFVSHNMAAVAQLCQHVIWVDAGKIKLRGHPDVVLSDYLSHESTLIAERRWLCERDAPGDEHVRLLAVRVLQENQVADVVDINQSANIEIAFAAQRPVSNLVSGVNLYNLAGTCLTATCDWRPNALASGVYRKQVTIPPHTLAEGRVDVLVQLVFFDPHRSSVIQPNAVAFDAVDSGGRESVRGPYKGEWPGVMRLKWEWTEAQAL